MFASTSNLKERRTTPERTHRHTNVFDAEGDRSPEGRKGRVQPLSRARRLARLAVIVALIGGALLLLYALTTDESTRRVGSAMRPPVSSSAASASSKKPAATLYVPEEQRRISLLKMEPRTGDDGAVGSPFDCETFAKELYAKPRFLDRSHELRHNVSFEGVVLSGQYVYYQMCVAVLDKHKAIRIEVSLNVVIFFI